MKLVKHSEFQQVYMLNNAAFERCQEAIRLWRIGEDTIPVQGHAIQWVPSSARTFVLELSRLFQHYNAVLWESFHYCQQCGGQCCVVGASYAPAFDLLALSLLELATPQLSEDITAREHECIYLSHHRCSWPEEWRTIKCWSFYCLGTSPLPTHVTRNELYRPIIAELRDVVQHYLPNELQVYETTHQLSFTDYLDDPIHFAEVLQQALSEIFVHPLNEVYPFLDLTEPHPQHLQQKRRAPLASSGLLLSENTSASIAEIAEQVCENPPDVPQGMHVTVEQLLEDLELLLWIIEGRPSNAQHLLTDLYQRYTAAPNSDKDMETSVWYRVRDIAGQLSRQHSI